MNTKTRFVRPAATIIEKDDGFVVEADMPGVTREGLQLTIDKDTLTICGHRKGHANGGRALHRESGEFDYQRVFELDGEIDRNGVQAQFRDGVLRLFLPKSEAVKPRRIEVGG